MNIKLRDRFSEDILLTFKPRKVLYMGMVFGSLILILSCATLTHDKKLHKENLKLQEKKISQSENGLPDAPCTTTYKLITGGNNCGFDSPKCLETVHIYCYPSKKLKEKITTWVDNPWYGEGP